MKARGMVPGTNRTPRRIPSRNTSQQEGDTAAWSFFSSSCTPDRSPTATLTTDCQPVERASEPFGSLVSRRRPLRGQLKRSSLSPKPGRCGGQTCPTGRGAAARGEVRQLSGVLRTARDPGRPQRGPSRNGRGHPGARLLWSRGGSRGTRTHNLRIKRVRTPVKGMHNMVIGLTRLQVVEDRILCPARRRGDQCIEEIVSRELFDNAAPCLAVRSRWANATVGR